MNKIDQIYTYYTQHYQITTDSRNIPKGSVFFALKGEHFDGNIYAKEALNQGAIAAVVDDISYEGQANIIVVENVLSSLQALAQHHRKKLGIPIISLTGSNGKTTTKELIMRVLDKKYTVQATKGNLNNHIGVPLSLLAITPQHEIAVIEMGANHQKEIEMLCEIALPDYGYVTNFGKAHLEGFGGIAGVIKGKTELYQYLNNHNKTAFLNLDDPIQKDWTTRLKHYSFATTTQETDVILKPLKNTSNTLSVQYKNYNFNSQLIGQYNFTNIAAAITIGLYFEVDINAIQDAIESYIPDNNRSQILQHAGKCIILDAYNANPSSMKEAVKNFANYEEEKCLILGDMFELGEYSLTEHQALVDYLETLQLYNYILIGNDFSKTNHHGKAYENMTDFLTEIATLQLPKLLLIKGSRGMKMEQILNHLN